MKNNSFQDCQVLLMLLKSVFVNFCWFITSWRHHDIMLFVAEPRLDSR